MLLEHPDSQIDRADFQLVSRVVYRHCGIALGDDKKSLVRARIARQMRAGRFSSVREYLDRVLSDRTGQAFAGFIDAICTNLTAFFREPDHYKYLAATVMPALLARKRQHPMLAWSAGCSSGEEAYSMAMTILQAMDTQPAEALRQDARILASDISTKKLASARAGVYEASRLLSVPSEYRSKYFTPQRVQGDDRRYAVSPELRETVRVRRVNLIADWPFDCRFDVIFCRNVMIYFDRQTQQRLVDRFCGHLSPGGFLFTGHSESLTGIRHGLAHRAPSVYQKPAEGGGLESNHAGNGELT